MEYEEEYEDVTMNQKLAPKTMEADTTEILNNLLKEYDKKLRPDIGGKSLADMDKVCPFKLVVHCDRCPGC
jgi:gmma-aminobutyric acid receptor subunit gamma